MRQLRVTDGSHRPTRAPSLSSTLVRVTLVVGLVALNAGAASAQLLEADFTGGTFTLCGTDFICDGSPFASLTWRGPNVSGSFIFDQPLVPGSGTGYVNVPVPSGTGEDPLSIVLGDLPGSLTLTAADGLAGNLVQVQYLNGHFNGFAYFAAFMYDNHEYQLDVNGTLWSIYDRAGGTENLSHLAASGYLDASLSNVRPYEGGPTITPEPASVVLFATGLVGIIGVSRRRRVS